MHILVVLLFFVDFNTEVWFGLVPKRSECFEGNIVRSRSWLVPKCYEKGEKR